MRLWGLGSRAYRRSLVARSPVRDLLATLCRVVDPWSLGAGLALIDPATRPRRPNRPGAGYGRWHVRRGDKRGDLVSPTKCGNGTKLMLLVDDAGLLLAVDIESACRAEVQLITSARSSGYRRCSTSSDFRSRRRQRQAPHQPGCSRYRVDLPTSTRPAAETDSRQPYAPPLSPPLDR